MSLLAFQKRVLLEGQEHSNPLLERVIFLSIFGSNIDEFFQVRVAVLKQRVSSGAEEPRVDGSTGSELLEAIHREVTQLEQAAYACLRDHLKPALAESGHLDRGLRGAWQGRPQRARTTIFSAPFFRC